MLFSDRISVAYKDSRALFQMLNKETRKIPKRRKSR